MKYNDFEQHIKDTLGSQRVSINEDSLIASLGLEEKRRPFSFWTFLMGLLSALVIGLGIYSISTARQGTVESIEVSTTAGEDKAIVSGVGSADQETPESQAQVTAMQELPEALDINNTDNVNSHTSANISLNNENTTNEATIIRTGKPVTDTRQELVAHNIVDIKTHGSESSTSPLMDATVKDEKTVVNKALLDETRAEEQAITLLPVIAIPLTADRDPVENKDKIICPDFKTKKWNFGIGAETGLGRPFSGLNFTGNEATQGFQYRKDREKSLDEVHGKVFGFLSRKDIPVGVKVGLSYNRMSTGLRLQDEIVEMDTTVGIISTTVSAGGDTITHIYGDIISTTTRMIDRTRHYYIHRLDIPLSVFYTVYFNRFAIQPELGINLNMSTWAEGSILTGDKTFAAIDDEGYVKSNTGLSYFGQVNFLYPLTHSMDLYAAPSFFYQPRSISRSSSEIEHSVFTPSLKLGVLWRLSR